jgi:DNA processing protein
MENARELLDLTIGRLKILPGRELSALCKRFDTLEALRAASSDEIATLLSGASEPPRNFDFKAYWTPERLDAACRCAEKDAAYLPLRGIHIVSIADNAYPALLRELYDPPAVLYYRGKLPSEDSPRLAVVGTRKASSAAMVWTKQAMRDIVNAGVVVVSGLAVGIDCMAHRSAMDAGGTTVAVLASSVESPSPAINKETARRILKAGGALVSEYPPGTPPIYWRFLARNRIIAGLCMTTLVVEAPLKSGACSTARHALHANRDVVVAAGKNGVFGEGCERFAEEGAVALSSGRDILEYMHLPLSADTPPIDSFSATLDTFARQLEL